MRPGSGAPLVSTFSIVARDEQTGDLGIAVASKYLAVGAVVPFATARVGAIATQSRAVTSHGPRGFEMLANGMSPDEVIAELNRDDPGVGMRQIGIVDAKGRAASFSGDDCIPWAGGLVDNGFCCQGNILAGPQVVEAMASGYREATGPFPERLIAALIAGHAVGGDRRGQQSAALFVVRNEGNALDGSDRPIDVRIDNHPRPMLEIQRLLALHRLTFGDPITPAVPNDPILVDMVQDQLQALGYLTGHHTDFDQPTRDALARFANDVQLNEWLDSPREIDLVLLDALRARLGEQPTYA